MTNAEHVHDIMRRALYQGETPDDAFIVEGIMGRFGFDTERISAVKPEVARLIRDIVPDAFLTGSGGGQAFLALAKDRNGEHWAEHQTIEALCCLAIATGQAQWCVPRDSWPMLPHGMPYVAFTPAE